MDWLFRLAWATGTVEVECIPNDDPDEYGTPVSEAVGFPVCTATVRYPRRGYNAMFGWVQLVRSTDNASAGERFEMDPFGLFADAPSPYCWFGTEPTLFDAPSRPARVPIEWLAYSFLATTPLDELLQGNPRTRRALARVRMGVQQRTRSSLISRVARCRADLVEGVDGSAADTAVGLPGVDIRRFVLRLRRRPRAVHPSRGHGCRSAPCATVTQVGDLEAEPSAGWSRGRTLHDALDEE